jgi:hypothetical protein
MQKVQVKFGDWMEGGFNLYKANFGTLVLASIFVVVISAITAGILAVAYREVFGSSETEKYD